MPQDGPSLEEGTDPPHDAKAGSFVDDYLLYLLAAVSDRASGQFHAHVRAHGLRAPEWRVLACLADEDGAMVTELARLSLLEQSRLTKIIDQMAARGLVSRRADPVDARRVRVFLTHQGRAQAVGLVADARAHEARLLALLTEEEAGAIKPVLRALLARMERS
ncbi:MarR family transcriptional regulator [Aestuariivita sp.]|jgi:DNA-binding MarR family transcriptional regulator|uniref:MarR family winged helix-turn-helix transcriptional regulator n=1 Tax=Aestuariivita sp. TaxID=1872407 RepID=UPI002171CB41|nr:MarR family transcriptional regulator [Aestuariivita sp.]MCE8008207.1 MarR family transcriptional regulator [Aestuariivita sp.]